MVAHGEGRLEDGEDLARALDRMAVSQLAVSTSRSLCPGSSRVSFHRSASEDLLSERAELVRDDDFAEHMSCVGGWLWQSGRPRIGEAVGDHMPGPGAWR